MPLAHRRRRLPERWKRLPLRIRLIAGFAAAMLVVLAAAGTFVYFRVEYALDLRLNEDLAAQSTQLAQSVPAHAAPALAPGTSYQLLDAGNHVLSASSDLAGVSLLRPDEAATALHRPVRGDRGNLFAIDSHTLRLYAVPLDSDATPPAGQAAVALVALDRGQRDEALRELIGQLSLANLAALGIASLVGYRLAHAALTPVERYRTEAARIAAGATGVRLAVPDGAHDEVARLGRTLNDMLTALESALDRERRLVNDASHELRTPLTLLATELELALRRPRTAAELEQTLRHAAADTGDLITLADTLLAIGVQPSPDRTASVTDLGVLVAEVATRHPGHPHLELTPRLAVRGDPTRLRQIVTNLLDNAVRHGVPPAAVATERVGGIARLVVHDAGPGMSPDFLPRAAERLTRADAARTSPGTGLGLALVNAIAHAHGGELRICSNGVHHRSERRFDLACTHPDTGTSITVLLPIAE